MHIDNEICMLMTQMEFVDNSDGTYLLAASLDYKIKRLIKGDTPHFWLQKRELEDWFNVWREIPHELGGKIDRCVCLNANEYVWIAEN